MTSNYKSSKDTFDIGQSGDLAIFTNNSEDIFNTNGDLGPSFTLDQGQSIDVADIGNTPNLVSGIQIDVTNESPIDFSKMMLPPISKSDRPQRQRIESNASNATIEAEPVKKRISSSSKFTKKSSTTSLPTLTHPEKYPEHTNESIPINYGFDELLDPRKLNKVQNDNESDGGDSRSTIKAPEQEYLSEPSSPIYVEKPMRTTRSYPQQVPEHYQEPIHEQEQSRYANDDDEKMDLLLKLRALESKHKITLSKNYNIKSSLDEIRMEYRNQSSILETEASIKFMKRGLIFCTSGMEYMNRRFDPIGAKLDGWGENVMENIMDYDGIFERLHHKYSGSVQMEPELELMFAIGGSAFMFHLSHTLFKTAIPQFGNVLRENPDLVQGIFGAVKEAAKRNGSVPMAANEGGNMESPGLDINAMLGSMGLGGGFSGLTNFAKSMGQPPPAAQSTRDIPEPPLNDLYRKMIHQQNEDNVSITSHESERSIGRATISPIAKRGNNSGMKNVIKL
jgi:hypothetical protein